MKKTVKNRDALTHQVQMRLTEEMYADLERLAKADQRTVVGFVRRVLMRVIDEEKAE